MSELPPHTQQLSAYARLVRWRVLIVAGLGALMLVAMLFDIATGPSNLAVADVVSGILSPSSLDAPSRVIIWEVRLPYALMAVLVGAALALAGAEMQTILNNPLASPFTLGVSSAAAFGAALALVLGMSLPFIPAEWNLPAFAFLFAFASVLLLQAMARLRGTGVETLVLFGIALVFTFNALVALVQYVASQEALQQLVFWSMGSLARSSWTKLGVLGLVTLIVVPFSLKASWRMTALRLGEDRARSFGISVARLRFFSLLRVSLLAATSVAFVGTIGFIGLVAPHIARLLVGEDHRFFLPGSMLAGAVIMSLASVASKTIVPGALLPVGIVTSLIGVPFFIALIFSRRERL
ncbi:transport system permease protein [Ancylobacter novellus DSM 506]|uniref:Transport system permease protein n=1 Tax=Ancylobacter novellus (strain ATCC 8093 / DSM 506 / JCM 20403 / CCM 1077 / IAM 12100 / NBRC 12443 / NCIMB 10456) TaxID=639283 RepID=D7A8R7_ANCN5|nr:iron ABC transporter permease [Ancylobacter novellus]ADH90601.1 transport system permease protein [Ancylobacter novellus DSM 506]